MGKKKVAIVTDSVSNLTPELIEAYDINVIPMSVNWEGSTYLDGVDITTGEFYGRLATCKEMPTTSQPSAGEFKELLEKIAEESESICCVVISDELSGTLASALAAQQMLPDIPIEIVDSRSASMGQGFIVMASARAAQEGANLAEVADAARKLVPITHAVFVVDTLEFLHRGGRIGGAMVQPPGIDRGA